MGVFVCGWGRGGVVFEASIESGMVGFLLLMAWRYGCRQIWV